VHFNIINETIKVEIMDVCFEGLQPDSEEAITMQYNAIRYNTIRYDTIQYNIYNAPCVGSESGARYGNSWSSRSQAVKNR
jgi:hypothetical protein